MRTTLLLAFRWNGEVLRVRGGAIEVVEGPEFVGARSRLREPQRCVDIAIQDRNGDVDTRGKVRPNVLQTLVSLMLALEGGVSDPSPERLEGSVGWGLVAVAPVVRVNEVSLTEVVSEKVEELHVVVVLGAFEIVVLNIETSGLVGS